MHMAWLCGQLRLLSEMQLLVEVRIQGLHAAVLSVCVRSNCYNKAGTTNRVADKGSHQLMLQDDVNMGFSCYSCPLLSGYICPLFLCYICPLFSFCLHLSLFSGYICPLFFCYICPLFCETSMSLLSGPCSCRHCNRQADRGAAHRARGSEK